jgi:hypothetical protein
MKKKQIQIFATDEDLFSVMEDLSISHALKLVTAGSFTEPLKDELEESVAPCSFTSYLILDRSESVSVRAIPQRDGGYRYSIDQLENPDSVSLHTGGRVADRLVAGQLGTATNEQKSDKIYSVLKNLIERKFTKIKSYYVGPEALGLLEDGIRLTPTHKSPKEYDLAK